MWNGWNLIARGGARRSVSDLERNPLERGSSRRVALPIFVAVLISISIIIRAASSTRNAGCRRRRRRRSRPRRRRCPCRSSRPHSHPQVRLNAQVSHAHIYTHITLTHTRTRAGTTPSDWRFARGCLKAVKSMPLFALLRSNRIPFLPALIQARIGVARAEESMLAILTRLLSQSVK